MKPHDRAAVSTATGAIIVLFAVLTGPEAIAENWTAAAWVCAGSDLKGVAESYVSELEAAARVGHWNLAVQVNHDDLTRRAIVVGGGHERVTTMGPEPASAAGFVSFLRWVGSRTAHTPVALVIFGHGRAGGVVAGAAGQPAATGSGRRGDGDLTAQEVAAAIEQVPSLRERLKVIALESCYGGSMEVAWGLRRSAPLLLARRGRAPAGQFVTPTVLGACDTDESAVVERFAREWLSAADASGEPACGVILNRVPEVCRALRPLVEELTRRIDVLAPDITVAASRAGRLGPHRELVDLMGFCKEMGQSSEAKVRQLAGEAVRALDAALLEGPAGAVIGPAVALPYSRETQSGDAVRRSEAFGAASGWTKLAAEYCNRIETLLNRISERPRRAEQVI